MLKKQDYNGLREIAFNEYGAGHRDFHEAVNWAHRQPI